ncbi:hypothetical protein TNCV_2287751 [Trichonephila clavipes]|nr:hypothetical protein TNCV_2287751 [Trichonephila clavipes]
MSRSDGQSEARPPGLSPQASLVLIYRPTGVGMKVCVDLAQPMNRTWIGVALWLRSVAQRRILAPPAKSGFGPQVGSYRRLQNHNLWASWNPSHPRCGSVRYATGYGHELIAGVSRVRAPVPMKVRSVKKPIHVKSVEP